MQGLSEPVLRAVPGNQQASGYGKDMDSILKEFIRSIDVHNTQISMLNVVPFKCIYRLEGSSCSYYMIGWTDKTTLI